MKSISKKAMKAVEVVGTAPLKPTNDRTKGLTFTGAQVVSRGHTYFEAKEQHGKGSRLLSCEGCAFARPTEFQSQIGRGCSEVNVDAKVQLGGGCIERRTIYVKAASVSAPPEVTGIFIGLDPWEPGIYWVNWGSLSRGGKGYSLYVGSSQLAPSGWLKGTFATVEAVRFSEPSPISPWGWKGLAKDPTEHAPFSIVVGGKTYAEKAEAAGEQLCHGCAFRDTVSKCLEANHAAISSGLGDCADKGIVYVEATKP